MLNDLKESVAEQIRRLMKDTVDYAASVLALLQARLAQYAVSTVLFTVFIGFASIFILAAFALLNVAFGVWLTRLLGSPLWSLLILGGFYGLLGVVLGWSALRWLFRLKS